jgi:hypothetical protein
MIFRSKDIGDIIYKTIQENRTPFSDALLKVGIGLAISVLVLALLEAGTRVFIRKTRGGEAEEATAQLIFSMIRYLILIAAGYLVVRACISEFTTTEVAGIKDMVLWLHSETKTLFDYGIKILIALVIFVLFFVSQNALFNAIRRKLDKKGVRESFSRLILNLVKYILLAFITVSSILQLMITGGDSLVMHAAYALVCVIIAIPFKKIEEKFARQNKSLEMLLSFMGTIAAVIATVAIAYGIFVGIESLLKSGGKDISVFLNLSETELSAKLNEEFVPNPALTASLSENYSGAVNVKSSAELNLIYVDGKLIGVNTSGRKYSFYGVSCNQPEITATREMTYEYKNSGWEVSSVSGGISQSHYFYNRADNTCLVMTVNLYSNRVVSMTWYSDFAKIADSLTLTGE